MIVEATAELIVESGVSGLTHRKIAARAGVPLSSTTQHFPSLLALRDAALDHLGSWIGEGVSGLAEDLAAAEDLPAVLGRVFFEYLSDPARVRSDAAFYIVATEDVELRPLATHWFDALVEMLTPRVGVAAARAVAVFGDGMSTYAMLHDGPLPEEELTRVFRLLLEDEDV
ncbi:TetR/AcrR family transcriptional regulator [Streptomyces sp. NPDC059255]|uniref:TetR/AcrR family transcriptional regulator n=1 Tax=Streptomyces sp. NPDC059255 TaxID=3346793 RepID=UPI00369A649D